MASLRDGLCGLLLLRDVQLPNAVLFGALGRARVDAGLRDCMLKQLVEAEDLHTYKVGSRQ